MLFHSVPPLPVDLTCADDRTCPHSVVAQDRAQYAEWTDGLNMLRSDSARIATKETKDLVDQLTDIGLKVGPAILSTVAHGRDGNGNVDASQTDTARWLYTPLAGQATRSIGRKGLDPDPTDPSASTFQR